MPKDSSGTMATSLFNLAHAGKDALIIPALAVIAGGLATPAFGVIAALGAVTFGQAAMRRGISANIPSATLLLTAVAAALTAINVFVAGVVPNLGVPLAVVAFLLPLVGRVAKRG